MISTIIIDDEQAACDVLKMELEKNCPKVNIVAICTGAKEGLLAIKKYNPDLVFLDIDMPWMTGLELIGLLPEDNLDIIFVTAHDEYAIQAIKTSALDFLTKPVSGEELSNAVSNVLKTKEKRKIINRYDFLLKQIEALKNNNIQQIIIPTQDGISFVNINEIVYCKADFSYTSIYLVGGKRLFVSKSLKEVDELLQNKNFYRCHKSYIINLNMIERYSKAKGNMLIMNNKTEIPLSRSKKIEFIALMDGLFTP